MLTWRVLAETVTYMYSPSSSCLKTILVGISIIGVMSSKRNESLSDVLVTVGN